LTAPADRRRGWWWREARRADVSMDARTAHPQGNRRSEHVNRFRGYAAWAALILPITAAGSIVGLLLAGQIR
jgi:hypothetical protein